MSERPSIGTTGASPERLLTRGAIALCLLAGLAYGALTPPLDAPDEGRHFGRVYMLSEGRISVPGLAPGREATLPVEFARLHPPRRQGARCTHDLASLSAQLRRPLEPGRRANAVRLSTRFSPVPYATQVVAVWIARAAGGSATTLLYAARLANLLTFVGLLWLALVLAPTRRPLIAAVALLPMSVFLAASVTADATTTGLALVFVALVLRAAAAGGPTDPAARPGVLLLVAAALGLTKPGYGLIAALTCAISPATLGGRRQAAQLIGGCLAVAFVPGLVWALFVEAGRPVPLGPGTDLADQLMGILTGPLAFLGVVVRTVLHEAVAWIAGAVGVLGWLDVALPVWIYLTAPLVLACAASIGDARARALSSARLRRAGGLVALATFLALLVLGYLAWNPVGSPFIADFHGRYLLPLLPLVGLSLRPRLEPGTRTDLLLLAFWLISLGATAVSLADRYWAPASGS